MSAKTTFPFKNSAQFADAKKVIGEVIIFWFSLKSKLRRAIYKVAVPFEHATAYLEPT